MNSAPLTVGPLIVAAFAASRTRYYDIYKRWIAASWRTGSKIPGSMAMASIQRIGEVDLICRSLEDELLQQPPTPGEMDFRDNYLMMFGDVWIGSAYAISFALKSRGLLSESSKFHELAEDLRLVRVQSEKHEIPSDRKLTEPLQLSTGKAQPGDAPERFYQYDKDDPLRAHIPRRGVSDRRSPMWEVIDVKSKTMRWLERRALADTMLDIFSP
jgi:hypothetical protein